MSDERQNQPILSVNEIARQKFVVCHAKIDDFIGHFLYIGQQILFMFPW